MLFKGITDRLSAAVILMCLSLFVSFSGWGARTDNLLYDVGQKLQHLPAPADIIIVAIDEASLAELGRWPWSRRIHAGLIDRLNGDGARVIGLDFIFAEPDGGDPDADRDLAESIRRAGNVVLPVVFENTRQNGQLIETMPLPELSKNAAGLGHVHVELDIDGIARSIFLRAGLGEPVWPHFAQAILAVGGAVTGDAEPLNTTENADSNDYSPLALNHLSQRRISFMGSPGHVQSLSYRQVLHGHFPAGMFKDKIVLVGATVTGLGDRIPTPVSGYAQLMSGVELNANIIAAIRDHRLIELVPFWAVTLVCAVFALLPLLWMPRISPLQGLISAVLWFVAVAGLAMLLPTIMRIWLPPSAALLPAMLAYPVWSWRKLDAAFRYLDDELETLSGRRGQTPNGHARSLNDVLQARIHQVQSASMQIRKLEEERREMLVFISHDIRAPLVTAIMNLDESNEDARRWSAPLKRALALANDFLQTARAEMINETRFQEIELTEVLHQAIDDAYSVAQDKTITLRRAIPEANAWCHGDADLLRRAVLNLVLNAVNYSPAGSDVEIGLKASEHEALIYVKDSGPGIPADRQAKLFERFSRGQQHNSTADGVGLGLYFVKVVAEKHSGSVDINSESGRQTTISLTVPICSEADLH